MREGCYKNTVYILLLHNTGIIEISSKIWFQWPIGVWHDILLLQLVCERMKGQNYMCHKKKKKKKKKKMSCQPCFEFNFDGIGHEAVSWPCVLCRDSFKKSDLVCCDMGMYIAIFL